MLLSYSDKITIIYMFSSQYSPMKAYFRAPRIGDHMMVRTLLLTGEDMGNGKGPQDDCLVGALPDGEYFFDWAHEHPTLDRSVRAKEVSAGYMQV